MNVRDRAESSSFDVDEGVCEQVPADGLDDVLDLRGPTDDASLRSVTDNGVADPGAPTVRQRLSIAVLGLHVLTAAIVVDERPA